MGQNTVAKVFGEIGKQTRLAEIRALNRAAKSAFSNTSKFIRETYKIKKEDLDKLASISRATLTRPVAQLIVKRKAVAASKYPYSFKSVKSGKNRSVRVRFKKGGAQVFKKAFVATMPSGHKGIFQRKGYTYLPIKEIYGPAGMDLFGSEESMKFIEKAFHEIFEKEFDHELQRRLK